MALILYYAVPLLLGYLLGSIPFGYIVGRCYGIDLTKEGSGSTGTTNVLRLVGKKQAAFVLAADFAKGALAPLLAIWLAPLLWDFLIHILHYNCLEAMHTSDARVLLSDLVCSAENRFCVANFEDGLVKILAAAAALVGHVRSVWLGFKGGKAVASGVGTFFALDWRVGILVTLIWFSVVRISKYSSLGALIAVPSSALVMWMVRSFWQPSPLVPCYHYSTKCFVFYCLLCAIYILWKHSANIKRLLNGTEPRLGQKNKTSDHTDNQH